MERSIALLVIGLIFGGGIGFVIAAGNGITLDGHDHDAHEMHEAEMAVGSDHAHETMMPLPADGAAPELDIEVIQDAASGWNLHMVTRNFRFAPDHVNQPHIAGEGHAHVYVNGDKIARAYGPWMHIGALPQGLVEIQVVLNSNDHKPLAINDVPVSATVSVEVE